VTVAPRAQRAHRQWQRCDTDIIVASAKAYLNALNKLQDVVRLNPQLAA